MKAKVKANGLLIPKKMLKGVKEAEITAEKGRIVVFPTILSTDPIFELGENPGHSGAGDLSTKHDDYLD